MALINTTTTGVLGSTFYGDGTGDLTVQQNGVTVNKITSAPTFMAYTLTQQTISHNSVTKVTLNTEEWDTANCFDTSLSRFTPNVAGYYQINASSRLGSMTATQCIFLIYKNGGSYIRGASSSISSGFIYPSVSGLVYCNGTSDYIEIYIYQNSGSTQGTDYTGPYKFNGFLARSA